MRTSRWCALVAVGLLAAVHGPLRAQDQPAPAPTPAAAGQRVEPPQQPIFRGRADFIRVDVIVSERKQPVVDLTAADFELFEDGKLQSIEQFKVVTVDGSVPANDPPPREIRSFDDEAQELGRDDIRVFVIFLDDYHVSREAAMRVREPLVRFVRRRLGPNDLIAIMYPLTTVQELTFTRDRDAVVDELQRFEGRRGDLMPRNRAEENQLAVSPGAAVALRRQVVLDAIEGLAVKLGGLREGRKSVLFVSEGFAASPRLGDEYAGLRDVIKAANRNNVAFYTLYPWGSRPGVNRRVPDLLWTLSTETDGRVTITGSSMEAGLAEMVRDASVYYLLGYNARSTNDGKFHELKVRVKRKSVEVRARKGFWAISLEEAMRAAAPPAPAVDPAILTALATIAAPGGSAARYGTTWVGTERAEAGKTRVRVVWDSSADTLRSRAGLRVAVTAVDGSGESVFSGQAAAVAPPRASQQLSFDAVPGQLELRLAFEDATGAAVDREIRHLRVPDFTAPELTVTTPRVFRGRTARDVQAARTDPLAVPAATRDFSRTERVLIKFDLMGPGSERATPRAILSNRRGNKVADLVVAPTTAGGTHEIEMGLNFGTTGDYVVEITVDGISPAIRQFVALRIGA